MNLTLRNKIQSCDFEKLFLKLGYSYFTAGDYNLNIIGIRSDNNNKVTDLFDDYLVVVYKIGNTTKKQIYNITTEPGSYYMLKHLGNPKGTAILAPGQYKGAWQLGLHKGKYKALCQRKIVKVYRDGNKDAVYDYAPDKIDKGFFGINIHRANPYYASPRINNYSAGCQVFQDPRQFNSFIRLCERQRSLYGNSFTYTLIREQDL